MDKNETTPVDLIAELKEWGKSNPDRYMLCIVGEGTPLEEGYSSGVVQCGGEANAICTLVLAAIERPGIREVLLRAAELVLQFQDEHPEYIKTKTTEQPN